MISTPVPDRAMPPARVLLSVIGHIALAGLVLLVALHTKTRPVYRESRCCMVALYWPGATNTGHTLAAPPARKRKAARHATPVAPAPSQNTSPAPAAQPAESQTDMATAQPQPTVGTGTGAENAEPAFPVYYPTPGVADASLLPSTERKVIVDVDISAVGEVTDERLVQGLGNGVDQIVLSTVKGWRFRPATLNGTAIASVEELVFPFSRNAPSTGA